jgi:RNase P protein component
MREALRAIEREKTLKVGFLIVIAARSASVDLKSTEIARQLDVAFKKLGMYEDAEKQ